MKNLKLQYFSSRSTDKKSILSSLKIFQLFLLILWCTCLKAFCLSSYWEICRGITGNCILGSHWIFVSGLFLCIILRTFGERKDMHCPPVPNTFCKVLTYTSHCSWHDLKSTQYSKWQTPRQTHSECILICAHIKRRIWL